ncbi:glutathione-regulated potassium-efflux system protein KefC [Ramlibacter sp. AN1015]|uniref:glutathione-regulated potassium-efflux system protein KefC n=1 Tax=Ramlibacter sp. AN1015 TaxID=3133428 RepID=UPI0030BAE6FC
MEHAPTWLTSSLLYLGAAVLAVPLARALGLGSVLGYLAAGIVIGPAGLALVSDVETILHFAEFGVVLMLFLIGLELEPRRLWMLRRPIFGWGSAQVLGCTALLFAAGIAAGAGWRLSLVAALGLALSSTAIALQEINERNLMTTPAGRAGLSILLFQDVAAIPILALVPLLGMAALDAPAASGTDRLLEALKVVAAIGAIILGGRLVLRPVLRLIARSRTPEIFTAAALLLVVATSALMFSMGLSMALGAFLAGVLLADSEYRRELETDIEPFKGLLLGLFFIAVGMSLDLDALARAPALVAALVLGFLAIKAALIWWLAGRLAIDRRERPVFTVLLAQGGEFAFVVFQAAAGARVFPPETASLLIGAVIISMLLGPLLLVAADRWLLPRWSRPRQLPELSEAQHAPVIVAGFGRYGQIVSRLLAAQGIATTLLDHDADMVEAARVFGAKVFFGDARRLDLLRTAGAQQARVLVVAVDDVAQSLAIVDVAREHFPHLELVVRARDVSHWYALRDRGVRRVERELFESSLRSGTAVLELLGATPEVAERQAARYREHNIALFERMVPHHRDRARLIAVAREGRAQFEDQMAQERAAAQAQAAASDAEDATVVAGSKP